MTEREMSNVAAVRAWVKALESGEFAQGAGQLANNYHSPEYQYCCLGVAVVVAQRAGVEVPDWWRELASWLELPTIRQFYGIEGNPRGTCQPSLSMQTPDSASGRVLCSEANDRWKLSFLEIAALLRKDYGLEDEATV